MPKNKSKNGEAQALTTSIRMILSPFKNTRPQVAKLSRSRPLPWKRLNDGNTIASIEEHA